MEGNLKNKSGCKLKKKLREILKHQFGGKFGKMGARSFGDFLGVIFGTFPGWNLGYR